jgi:chromosome segregation ATPase
LLFFYEYVLKNVQISFKRKELNDSKLEICNLSTDIKTLKNELQSKDNQINILKEKLSELNLEVLIYF